MDPIELTPNQLRKKIFDAIERQNLILERTMLVQEFTNGKPMPLILIKRLETLDDKLWP